MWPFSEDILYNIIFISVILATEITTSNENGQSIEGIDSRIVERISRLKNQQFVGNYSQTEIENMKIIHWLLGKVSIIGVDSLPPFFVWLFWHVKKIIYFISPWIRIRIRTDLDMLQN